MTTPSDDLDRLKSEGDVLSRVEALESKVSGLFRESIEAVSVDEITTDLGEIRMGRFLATESDGDPTDPTFSGVFMVADPETFGDTEYHFGGVRTGELMFGGNADTGRFDFCGGLAYIDSDGITGNELLKWMIKQCGKQGEHERVFTFGMEELNEKPSATIAFRDMGGAELLTNGGAEAGDLTGWTDEDGGRFNVSTVNPHSGSYCFEKITHLGGVLYQDKNISDSKSYILTGYIYKTADLDDSINIGWYNNDDFIILEYMGVAGLPLGTWTNIEKQLKPPAGANKLHINFLGGNGTKFDDISLLEITVNQKLQLRDDGLYLNGVEVGGGGDYPDQWLGNYATFCGFKSDGTRFTPADLSLVNTSWQSGIRMLPAAAECADGDYYTCQVELAAGTYNFHWNYGKYTSSGKCDLYIDGVKVNATTLDCYASSASYNNQWDLTGITVATSGMHEIKFLINGKNASSSDYTLVGSMIIMKRTA